MTTPLHPLIRKYANDAFDGLIRSQITPWVFLHSGRPFRISRFDKSEISYQGILFEGSPRDVFWGGYIEPFIEHLCTQGISYTTSLAKEKSAALLPALELLRQILHASAKKVYGRMADVDRRLLGKGYPSKISKRSTETEYKRMEQFINEHIDAEVKIAKSEFLNHWIERNPFWKWAIPITLTAVLAVFGLWYKGAAGGIPATPRVVPEANKTMTHKPGKNKVVTRTPASMRSINSKGQSGGFTGVNAGTLYQTTTILASTAPEEAAKKKKIREQLGKFIQRLMAQDMAARAGWGAEDRKAYHAEDPIGEIQQYLKDNLDESYAVRIVYPEVEDLSLKKYDNQYQGQGESELARARMRFLNKIIDEQK